MRLCPTVDGSATPLITHRIGADVCQTRQCANYHKCHRCIYRGKAANWEPETPPLAMINVHAAEEPATADVKRIDVTISTKAPAKAGKGDKVAKPAGKVAAKTAAAKAAEAAL
jgi:hypothetical protein